MNNAPLQSACRAQLMDPRIGVLMRDGREIYYAVLGGRCVQRRSIRGVERCLARHDQTSLARANGWGSAGQCPALACVKTPAAGEQVRPATAHSACGTQPVADGEGIRA